MRAVFRNQEEQAIVADYLHDQIGTFVEVGAFDPVVESQTFHLEQRGWSGVLIEPVPEFAVALRNKRCAQVFEVACGAPEHHGTRMPIRVTGGLSSLRETFITERLSSAEILQVPVVTLDHVLLSARIYDIDFLSVDVEGFEMSVLRGLSFDRFKPRLILIEDWGHDWERHRFLRKHGYKRVRRTGNNSWYVPNDVRFPISLFGRWQLWRKYYLSVPLRRLRDRRQLARS